MRLHRYAEVAHQMITTLLILHGLVAVALLGGITHQVASLLAKRAHRSDSFVGRYTSVDQRIFTLAVASLYATNLVLGSIIYPTYRLNVRIPFQEMGLGWAIGLFELKEHFAGVGLALLPVYCWLWRPDLFDSHRHGRVSISLIIAFIVWWDFIVGHVLNNLRGLG